MGLFDSSRDRGKKDGTEKDKDFISHTLDEDYRKGYDHGEGLRDGSKMAKDEDGDIVQIAADALFNREGLEKMGKSNEYKKGYDRGKETYGEDTSSGGSSDSNCFITTACIQVKGLPDDCYELSTLRAFRDNYIRKLPNGNQIVNEYYKLAPKIVKKINEKKNMREIYSDLYQRLVLKSIQLIQSGQKRKAYRNYLTIVNDVKRRYLN